MGSEAASLRLYGDIKEFAGGCVVCGLPKGGRVCSPEREIGVVDVEGLSGQTDVEALICGDVIYDKA